MRRACAGPSDCYDPRPPPSPRAARASARTLRFDLSGTHTANLSENEPRGNSEDGGCVGRSLHFFAFLHGKFHALSKQGRVLVPKAKGVPQAGNSGAQEGVGQGGPGGGRPVEGELQGAWARAPRGAKQPLRQEETRKTVRATSGKRLKASADGSTGSGGGWSAAAVLSSGEGRTGGWGQGDRQGLLRKWNGDRRGAGGAGKMEERGGGGGGDGGDKKIGAVTGRFSVTLTWCFRGATGVG